MLIHYRTSSKTLYSSLIRGNLHSTTSIRKIFTDRHSRIVIDHGHNKQIGDGCLLRRHPLPMLDPKRNELPELSGDEPRIRSDQESQSKEHIGGLAAQH